MSQNLVNLYGQQYASAVSLLLQQKGSKLRSLVSAGSYTGSQASPVDQVGSVEMQPVAGRFGPMGRVDAAVDRRWVFPSDFDLPQLVDSFDKLRLFSDPQSTYVTNAVYAAGRKMDDLIISAAFGTAKTGVAGATNTSFLAGNVVGVNTGGTASKLNVAKLREAKRLLMANEVDFDAEEPTVVVSSTDHDALLNEIQVISSDFNGADRPVLQEGKVERFLGMRIVQCERPGLTATATDDQAGSSRQVPVFVKSGMHLGIWNDISTDIAQRKDLQGLPWQAYVYMTAGATRIEEKKIVKIWCR